MLMSGRAYLSRVQVALMTANGLLAALDCQVGSGLASPTSWLRDARSKLLQNKQKGLTGQSAQVLWQYVLALTLLPVLLLPGLGCKHCQFQSRLASSSVINVFESIYRTADRTPLILNFGLLFSRNAGGLIWSYCLEVSFNCHFLSE